jgi:hypothetical protein
MTESSVLVIVTGNTKTIASSRYRLKFECLNFRITEIGQAGRKKKNSPAINCRGVKIPIRSNRMGVSAEGGNDLTEEQVLTCPGKRVNYSGSKIQTYWTSGSIFSMNCKDCWDSPILTNISDQKPGI